MTFYDNFIKLCVERGIKPANITKDLGIKSSTISTWKLRGNTPTDTVVQKIANYFGVSPIELIPLVEMPMDKLSQWSPIDAYVYLKKTANDKGLSVDDVIEALNIDPMLFQMAMFKRSGYDNALKAVYNVVVNDEPLPNKKSQPANNDEPANEDRANLIKMIEGMTDEQIKSLSDFLILSGFSATDK